MKLTYTDDAASDIIEIGEFIARDDPATATRFLERLQIFIEHIPEHPEAYRKRDAWGAEVRAAVFGNYLTIFEMVDETVVVLRVLNGRRNIVDILRDEK